MAKWLPAPSLLLLWNRFVPYIFVGIGTLVAQIIALVGMKCWAVMVGVEGVGQAGVILGGSSILGTLIGFGISSGVMRWGPERLADGDHEGWDRILGSAWWTWGLMACVGFPLGSMITVLGWLGLDNVSLVLALTLPVIAICQSATILLLSEVNARQQPKVLSLLAPANSIGQLVGVLPILIIFGLPGVYLALLVGNGLGLTLTWWIVQGTRSRPIRLKYDSKECLSLIRFGGPWMLAALGGGGVASVLPILIAHELGEAVVGWYRAGTTIAVQYMAVLMGVLAQVYAPKISSVRNDPYELNRLVRRQSMVTVNLVGFASIILVINAGPIISLLYTKEFYPAKDLVCYYLVGMPLRAFSWCLGYVALATAPGWVLLVGELFTGAIWLSMSWILIHTKMQLAGLGLAFAITYAIHCGIMTIIALRCGKVDPLWGTMGVGFLWSTVIYLLAASSFPNNVIV